MEKAEEIVEVLDHMARPLGIASRRMSNQIGLWHLCVQCWILVNDPVLGPALLLQKRSMGKSVSPGKLDVSASGHVVAGGLSINTVVTEAQEELNIDLSSSKLIYAGRRVDMYEAGGVLSRIFADVYFVQWGGAPTEVKLDDHEVDAFCTIALEDGFNFFLSPVDRLPCRMYQKEGLAESTSVRFEDFITRYDRYYLKVFNAAKLLQAGSHNLFI